MVVIIIYCDLQYVRIFTINVYDTPLSSVQIWSYLYLRQENMQQSKKKHE